jgi:uncharacterized protein
MPTSTDEVYRLLLDANPWWDSGRVPVTLSREYHRRDYYVLKAEERRAPIVALGGPRQVGKTTLLFQLIEDLVKSGVDPQHVFFVSFDLPGLSSISASPLNDSLNVYAERVLGTPWRSLQSRVYVFLDEITKVQNWHQDLKGWFDLRYPIKFFVSSSSISELRAGSSKSLTGRVSTHLLMTWKFVDALMFLTEDDSWNDVGLRLREAFAASVDSADPRVLERRVRTFRPKLVRQRTTLQSTLDRYLLLDGFPELLESRDLQWCARRLREYLTLTIANDLYRFFQIRATGLFEDLLGLIARESGQLISYRNLAETLRVEERTIIEYLDYLESVFLVSRAQYYSESRAKRIRRQRKAYLSNPGLRNALLGRVSRRTLTDPQVLGPQAEGLAHDHAKRLVYCLDPGPTPEAFYWRDRQNREVDIVISVGGRPVPIEVKYRTDPHRDLEGIRSFISANSDAPFGLVITRDVLEIQGRILFLPLSHFLLMV